MSNRWILVTASVLCILSFAAVFADAPLTISYQGRLTDATGDPVSDGSYDIVVRFWDSESDATPEDLLWTSSPITVTVTNGLFTTLIDIDPAVFLNNIDVWMGVAIGTDDESAPRRRLVSSPFAIDAHHANFADNTYDNWIDSFGDVLYGDIVANNGVEDRIRITPYGSQLQLLLDGGSPGQACYSGSWSENAMWSNNGMTGLISTTFPYTGAANGGQVILLSENGAWAIDLNAGLTGDWSVVLPSDAINSVETLNEPGIASNANAAFTDLPVATKRTMVSLEIEIPADGYISLEGRCGLWVITSTSPVLTEVLITDDPNEDGGFPDLVQVWLTPGSYVPVYSSRIYYKTAGTHTFYLVGQSYPLAAGHTGYYDPVLTATYFPTSYGVTRAFVPASKSGDFSSREPITDRRSAAGTSSATGYQVDLRELEIRALKARADAERAEKELLKAKIAERQEAMGK